MHLSSDRLAAIVTALLLLTAACTGAPPPQGEAPQIPWTEPGATGAPAVGEAPSSPRARSAAAADTLPRRATSIARASSSVPPPISGAERKLVEASDRLEEGLAVSNLWSPEEERIGIEPDEIRLCLHAALTLAEAFGGSQQKAVLGIGAYWRWLNDRGGVFGRKVEMAQKDDRYRPETSRAAAEQCKAERPFLFLGAPGYDQTDVIREWNEQPDNRLPYIHWQATLDPTKRYSFSFEPAVEALGRVAGSWVASHHAGRKIGIVWRDSAGFKAQRDEALARLRERDVDVVADISVQYPQPGYTHEILRLKKARADVVMLIANPRLEQDPFIAQALRQEYRPKWFLSIAGNTTINTFGKEAQLEGVSSWPAYTPGLASGPYADEIRRFERAVARYARTPPDDYLWAAWLDMKQIHIALLACGRDCTRDEFVSLMASGRIPTASPNCPLRSSGSTGVVTWAANVFEESSAAGKPIWTNARMCRPA